MKISFSGRGVRNFIGATLTQAGLSGLVPAPTSGKTNQLLSSSGQWVDPPSVFSMANETMTGAGGLIPTPTAGEVKWLSSHSGWSTLPLMVASTASEPGQAGLVPAPPIGAPGSRVLTDQGWAVQNTSSPNYAVATTTADGTAGLVPAPLKGATELFLSSKRGWVELSSNVPTLTGASATTGGQAGLAPTPAAGDQKKVLMGSGSWSDLSAPEAHSDTSAYASGRQAFRGSLLVSSNGACPAGTAFKWGVVGATWRPVFMPEVTEKWMGVYAGSAAVGDVVAASETSSLIYVCHTAASSGTSLSSMEHFALWSPVLRLPGVFSGATSNASGQRGLVPAPSASAQVRFLASTGEWAAPTVYQQMGAATAGAAGTMGLVPAPAAGDQDKVLTGSGVWRTLTIPTYSSMTGASATAAGGTGLVPAPKMGDQDKVLNGAGLWVSLPSLSFGFTDLKSMIDSNLASVLASLKITSTANSWSAKQSFPGNATEVAQLVTNSSEKVTLDSSSTGATLIPMQLSSQSILYLSGLSADARVNLTHSSSASLNTVLSIGECVTITIMIRNSATAYLFKELQIDSVSQTLRWMDGSAPSAATASGTDVYSFTILKTASAAYEVLGSAASYK